jgi:type II secretory pathway component PulF
MFQPTGREMMSGPLSHDEVARLSGQIANLTAVGLPLGPGLEATARELPHGRLRSCLFALARSLDAGMSVGEAVESLGGRLPGHLRGLVEIGSKTGRMSQVLGRFVSFLDGGAEIRRRLTISLMYPIFALFMAMAIFVLVCVILVGMFEAIFKDFGIPLPLFTLGLLRVARVFQLGWRPLVEAAIGLCGLWVLARFALSARVRRSLISGVPVLGAVWWNTSLAEFCHLLALLLESEIPLSTSLKLTGEGVGDASVERACRALAADVEGGLPLSLAIARQPLFPRGLSRLLRWAEGQQTLPESLDMAGEMFAARARAQASFAGAVLSVLSVLSILAGIAAVVVGLFIPLITLISKLSG